MKARYLAWGLFLLGALSSRLVLRSGDPDPDKDDSPSIPHEPRGRASTKMATSTPGSAPTGAAESIPHACDSADPIGGIDCIPRDSGTGEAYSADQMKTFDEIRRSCKEAHACGRNNRALPEVLDAAEYAKRRAILERTAALRASIDAHRATEDEIGEYYGHVNQVIHHKRQVAEFILEDGHSDPGPNLEDTLADLKRVDEMHYLMMRIDLRLNGHRVDLDDGSETRVGIEYDRGRLRMLQSFHASASR